MGVAYANLELLAPLLDPLRYLSVVLCIKRITLCCDQIDTSQVCHRDLIIVIVIGLGEHAHLSPHRSWSKLECHLDYEARTMVEQEQWDAQDSGLY